MRALFALFCSALAGCTGVAGLAGGFVKAYEGPERSDTELAILFTPREPGGMFTPISRPKASLIKVNDQVVGGGMQGYPFITKVLPGVYRIQVSCYVPPNLQGSPSLTATLAAGHTYELVCSTPDRKVASASYIDRGTSYKIER